MGLKWVFAVESMIKKGALFLGKFLLGFLFVVSGLSKVLDWNSALFAIENVLCEWGKATLSVDLMQELIHHLLNFSSGLLIAIIVFEVLGGIFLIFGYRPRLGAIFCFLVMVFTTFLYHSFWIMPKDEVQSHLLWFLNNLGVMGGLLLAWVNTGAAAPKPSGPPNGKR